MQHLKSKSNILVSPLKILITINGGKKRSHPREWVQVSHLDKHEPS